MNNYVIDFETYYSKKDDISAGTIGLHNYAEKSYAYIVSIVGQDVKFVGTIEEARTKFPEGWWTDPQKQFWAANANFDYVWTRKLFGESARPWKCILDRGAVSQLPHSLAGITGVVFGQKADKTLRDWMDGRHWDDLSAGEKEEMKRYCLSDSELEYRLLEKLPEMSTIEDAVAEHTRRINLRGVHIDVDLLEEDKTRLQAAQHRAFCAIPWHNDGTPLSHQQLARYCNIKGLPVPASLAKEDNDELDEMMDAHPELAAVVDAMRRFRKSNTMIRKIESIQARLTPDNRIPLEMMFCGARHTRRWSCRGVNVQNLDREPYFLTPGAAEAWKASGKLVPGEYVWPRHWIVPPPGKLFLSLDYAQIEPRCLNWLAGNETLLDRIRAGYSVYEAYAATAKGWKGAPGTLKNEVGVAAYTLIKNEVLGLGYSMGFKKYAAYAGINEDTAKLVVSGFRRSNPKIVAMWRKFDELIKSAALDREHLLSVTMPSGDVLRHFHVRGSAKHRGFESFTTRGDFSGASLQPSLHGGVLTENVVQRMARDILAEAVIKLERAGFTVCWTTHDEIILAVDPDNKEDAKAEAEQIMKTPPEWAEDLPLGVEGGFSDRYTK